MSDTILIAPNAFKGSLSVLQAARALAQGARRALPHARIELMPISDGGDGLMDCLLAAKGGRRVSAVVLGPLGERRRAAYARLKDGSAVIETALACGLALVPPGRRDPLGATSYGAGQLIDAALRAGARRLVIGLGGSASSDGGAGLAQALGARLLDARGRELPHGLRPLLRLDRVDARALRSRLKGVEVIAVTDVVNPLLGPRGSAAVYGPQKGATPRMVALIEKALSRYARILKRDLGAGVAGRPGAGAAGGSGAAVVSFLRGRLAPGALYVLKECGAAQRLRRADAVLTGEGRLDATSFYGKAPLELARLALKAGVPAAAICGSVEEGALRRLRARGLISVTLAQAGATPRQSLAQAGLWAARAAALAVKELGLGEMRG